MNKTQLVFFYQTQISKQFHKIPVSDPYDCNAL